MTEDKLPQELHEIIEILKKISKITGEQYNFNHLQESSDIVLPISNALIFYLRFIYYILKMGEGLENEIDSEEFESRPLREIMVDIFQKFSKNILNDLDKQEALKGFIEFFAQTTIAPSFQILYETISISHDDPLEEQIRSKFIEAFDKAYMINERAIVKLFINLRKSIANQVKLLDLLSFSSYNKLGIGTQNIEDMTVLYFLELIYNKKEKLLELEENEIKDVVSEFIRRFNILIESYLKLILTTIVNLERIANNEKFVSFHNSLGYFARSLNLDRIYLGNYLDLRNSISHGDFIINIDKIRKKIEIRFIFRWFNREGQETSRDTRIYSFSEIIDKFKSVKAFSNTFLGFLKAFIFKYLLKKEGINYSELISELRTILNHEFNDDKKLKQTIDGLISKLETNEDSI